MNDVGKNLDNGEVAEKEQRDKRGRFVEGHAFAGGGRKGIPNKITTDFLNAVAKFKENPDDPTFFDHVMKRVKKSDQVLVAVLRKLVPDKLELEGAQHTVIRCTISKAGRIEQEERPMTEQEIKKNEKFIEEG